MFGEIIGGLIGAGASAWSASKQNKLQRDIAKNQIRWRVDDAKAAGIHPLAALGANVQPVSSQPLLGDSAIAGLAEAGKAAFTPKDELAERQSRANARLTEAQAAEAEARSRTIAQAARQPVGATIGNRTTPGETRLGPHVGTLRRTGRYDSAQKIQDEYGDLWENVFGSLNLFDQINSRSMGRRHRRLMSRAIRRRGRPNRYYHESSSGTPPY